MPNDDPMKARARKCLEKARGSATVLVSAGSDAVGRNCDYTLDLAKLLAAFATKERSVARREGMEAAAKIVDKYWLRPHGGFGAKIAAAIRAQIAEEAKHAG